MATETQQKLRSGATIAVAIGIMNVATYGFNILAAHTIGTDAYGAFSALLGVMLVISVLSLGLQATGARRISAEPDQVVAIERVVLGVGLRSAVVLGVVLLALSPLINVVLHLESIGTALLVGVTAIPLTYMGAQAGVLQGEQRWTPLAVLYLSQGVGRIIPGAIAILISPTEFSAMIGLVFGFWMPVLVGWLALRRPRSGVPHSEGHPGLELIREVANSSQALLAFFALSNVDILVARATMPTSQAGLYAAGLIMVKAILFLPQFVVVVAFPTMSKGASRKTLVAALGLSAVLGAVGVLAVLVLPRLALIFVGGSDFDPIADDLWKFAIVGTLLSMIQLLVYSALARRQGRATLMIWTLLVVLVVGALAVGSATSLVMVVVLIDTVLFVALLVTALNTTPTPIGDGEPLLAKDT